MMLFTKIAFALYASGLGSATPYRQDLRRADDEIDAQTFKENIGETPSECEDFLNPSEECMEAIKSSIEKADDDFVGIAGGQLYFGCCSTCDDSQVNAIKEAAWDAYSLSAFAKGDPSNPETKPIWKTWMGPDYLDYQDRILGNLDRVANYQHKKKYDIYMSCQDTKQLCGDKKIRGKSVGGYAWNYKGWFGIEYYYITLCPVFFKLDSLSTKTEAIEGRLKDGDSSWAEQADWQRNMGQFFLHEMMHLNGTSKGQPHITDEVIDPKDSATPAYGPGLVHLLAKRAASRGGGAKKASTNADSYAWLANSMYFYKQFNHYPLPPGKSSSDSIDDYALSDDGPLMLNLGSFSSDEHVTDDAFNSRFEEAVEGYASGNDNGESGDSPPAPQCSEDGSTFTEDEANSAIDDFCNDLGAFDDTLVVPPISIGVGATEDDRAKILGVYSDGAAIDGTDDKLWMGVHFATEDCMGSFSIATGDKEKDASECKSHLQGILGGCKAKSGQLQDVCEVWYLQMSKSNPADSWWEDRGEVECGDTCSDDECRETLGDDLADTCTCWYSNYSTVTETYARPDSGKCDAKDVDRAYNYGGT